MYTIAPENTWATRYQLHKDEQLLGTIVTSGWMSVYTITLPDDEIVLKNRKWYSLDVNVVRNGELVATATHVIFSYKPEVQIQYNNRLFRVVNTSVWSRDFTIHLDDANGGMQIGTITRSGTFTKNYAIEVPDSVEPWFVGLIGALLIKQSNSQAIYL